MKAGVHGPAVTIFVVMSLLCVAEKQGAESAEEVRSIPSNTSGKLCSYVV